MERFDGAVGGRQAFDRQQVLGLGARARGQVAGLAEVHPLPLDPQVGLDDSLVLLNVLGPALGDQTPVVENVDLLGDAHHQLDVVLDEKHRDPRSR